MFKVEITEKYTKMEGRTNDILAGLLLYIDGLRENNVSDETIKKVLKIAFEKEDEQEKILDVDKTKVQKIDLNNMSKEEAKETIDKELSEILDEIFK